MLAQTVAESYVYPCPIYSLPIGDFPISLPFLLAQFDEDILLRSSSGQRNHLLSRYSIYTAKRDTPSFNL